MISDLRALDVLHELAASRDATIGITAYSRSRRSIDGVNVPVETVLATLEVRDREPGKRWPTRELRAQVTMADMSHVLTGQDGLTVDDAAAKAILALQAT